MKVTASCHGPIGTEKYKNDNSPWEDVYLSWTERRKEFDISFPLKFKRKQKKKYAGPCIIGYKALLRDIEMHEHSLKNWNKTWFDSMCLEDYSNERNKKYSIEQIEELTKIKEHLSTSNYYIEMLDDGCSNIYVISDYINREMANNVCKILLREKYNLEDVEIVWEEIEEDLMIIPS